MIDESSEFGARVARHLREEMTVWLTTVTPSGAPHPAAVGFVCDGGENASVSSRPVARIRNIARNPTKVTLNFGGDEEGGRHRDPLGHRGGGRIRSERRRGRRVSRPSTPPNSRASG